VWLQNPDILNDTAQCKEVFSIIFERFKLKTLGSSTKARIIQTFIKFLDLYSDKMREEHEKDLSFTLLMIQKELSQFVHLLDSKDHAVRASVAEMIIKIDELGLLPLIDGAKIFIKMLNDCNPKTIKAANLALKKIAQKKLSLVVVCASPVDMILESYRYQKLIYKHPKLQLTSGFVKILDSKMNQLTYWNNIGIFDDLLEFLNQNDENVIHSLVKSLIKFIEDPNNY
jgi:HEAT repeat protein